MVNVIDVKSLSYNYLQEKNLILKDISFTVKEGEVYGIIGPSGCGKSTLLLALSGLIPYSIKGEITGNVMVNGKDISKSNLAELSQNVQLLFQSPDSQLFALNVEDEITFGLENLNFPWFEIERRLNNVLEELGIENLRNRSIEELSSGQKQKVALASILAMEPKILLFDEPTANLDQFSIKGLVGVIKELRRKHTIVIVEHNVELITEVCDRVLLIDNGKVLVEDKTENVFKSKEYGEVMLPPHNIKEIISKIERIKNESNGRTLLEIKDLNFKYPNNVRALSDVHLKIGKGDFVGILGLNGSGKSTLVLNIIGILKGSGKILLDHKDISKNDVYERTKKIGYVFQNPNYQLFEENLYNEIAFGLKNIGLSEKEVKNRVEEVLHIINLAEFRDSDPHALSVGQKRRVSVASILAMKPEIIIVDEPDTGLDHKNAKELMGYIKELNESGKTIILISHSIELIAEYCNRIIGMKDGKVVDPKEVYEEYFNL
ncbi:ABC transporter ATP-binding protein [Candidatus Woesearchaeota archaeon]|nr:ABC transporter ATP-binding protein [Candidatus Woesearchaeota archaeon]